MQVGELLPPLVSLTQECEVCDIKLLLHVPCSVNVRRVRSSSLGLCVISGTYIHAIGHAVIVYGLSDLYLFQRIPHIDMRPPLSRAELAIGGMDALLA
jgi:hypothetical protein